MILGLLAAVGISLTAMTSVTMNQQEIAKVDREIVEKQTQTITEIETVSAIPTELGNAEINNQNNEDVRIIQIRVYDDDGNIVGTYPMDQVIQGNAVGELILPAEVQELMLLQ